jgi:hypothetical protein
MSINFPDGPFGDDLRTSTINLLIYHLFHNLMEVD